MFMKTQHTYYGREMPRQRAAWGPVAALAAAATGAAILIGLLATTPAHSQEACKSTWKQLVKVSDELVANHPNVKETKLEGARAKNLLALVHTIPGYEAIDFDGVVLPRQCRPREWLVWRPSKPLRS
jgi:hypothetical protein